MAEVGDDGLTEVEALVAHGLELDGEEREAWLGRLRPGEAHEVRDRLDRLAALGLASTSAPGGAPVVGGFRLVERVGAGGMGEVWRAESGTRTVALKILRPGLVGLDGARQRFEREARAVRRVRHPGIVRILEVGEDSGLPWMALEWVAGSDLESVLDCFRSHPPEAMTPEGFARALAALAGGADGPLPSFGRDTYPRLVAHLCARVAAALHAAHEAGVLHRDVKPSNVLLGTDGRVLLGDFGLARTSQASRVTRPGSWLGSLPYAAPEQVQGSEELDVRADVYSLGATLYECLALRTPFLGGSEAAVRARILAGDLPALHTLNRSVPRAIEDVCMRALDPNPARRYATAGELADDLDRAAAGRPVRARPAPAWLRLARWTRRRPRLSATLVVATAMLLLATAWAVRERAFSARIARLSDAELVERLEREALALWPPDPERLRAIDGWLERADDVLARAPLHRTSLARLRATSLPPDPDARDPELEDARETLIGIRLELEGLARVLFADPARRDPVAPMQPAEVAVACAEWSRALAADAEAWVAEVASLVGALTEHVAARPEARVELDQLSAIGGLLALHARALAERDPSHLFRTDLDQWQHDALTRLLSHLQSLESTRARVVDLRLRCTDIAESARSARAAWTEVRESIARSPVYRGLVPEPRTTLLPLREDPGSGLWEFLLLGTGEPPDVDPGDPTRYRVRPETGIVLVLLPGGEFEMGLPEALDTGQPSGSLPRHPVALDPFYVSKYELTCAQAARLGDLPNEASYQGEDGDLPVRLGWGAARELLAPYGLDHPTEAQWEYAACPTPAACAGLAARANLRDPAGALPELLPVGSLPPGPHGLHDVLGNVDEWCRDWRVSRGYRTLPSRPGDGLKATVLRGTGRAARGGHLFDGRGEWNPYLRRMSNPEASPYTGVRPVLAAR